MTHATIQKTIDPMMICPASGLPVKSCPEWTDRQFGRRYRLTTRVVGDRILMNQPSGYAELQDIIDSMDMTDEVLLEHVDASAGYVQVSDYSGMRGITNEARRYYIRHMRRRENMLALIYFGVSPLFSLMIKLARRMSLIKFNVRIARDYGEAMSAAIRLTGAEPMVTKRAASISPLTDAGITEHVESGHRILRCDRWRLALDDYSLAVEVIDGRVYHALSAGTLRAHHLAPVAQLREQVRRMLGLDSGFAAIVTGTGDAHSSDWKARKQYMASLRQWHHQYPMDLYVFYNANRFIRTAAMLATPFMPFKVKVAQDLASALTLVDRFAGSFSVGGKKNRHLDEALVEDSASVVHQLLQFIGDIDWERHSVPRPDPVNRAHPFRPVFDAIALIKGELDGLLEERRKSQEALLESQQRFEEVLKHSRDILFKRNINSGTYEYISDAISDLLGITPESARSMGFGGVQSLVHPDDLPRFLAFNKKLLASANVPTETDHVIEYRLRDREGRYRWFSDSHAIVRDADGQPAFVIGSNRDITSQKFAEKELKDSHERFTTVLDSINAHIYVADMKTHEVLFMNQAMRDDFGNSRLGDACFHVFRKNTDVCPDCTTGKLLDEAGQPTGILTWEGLNPVKNRWYLYNARAIRWVDNRMVRLQIAIDIDRIKSLEAERQEIAERLRHTRKLEAVSTMAGGVAHNFNNLLMVVLGNLELMRMNAPEGGSLSRRIDAAEKSAQRAADLGTLMLTYVGQTRISPQNVNLNATVSEMVDVMKTSVAENATLTVDASDSPCFIHADVSKVCQVITNLVTNAVEASSDQPLEIRLRVGDQHCDVAQLSRLAPGEDLPAGRYIWLRVADNGQGMDQDTLEKVFDPFFTTKFTGRGLGMAAVMGIMRAHRGGIRIDSRPDAGTAVTVYFPERKEAAETALEAPAALVLKGRGKALLVDDEPLVLELGKQMLVFLGFDVLTAANGLEAVSVAEANSGQIRMAVLDINMPRMSGRETVERLRGIGAAFPILVASGFTEAQSREKMGDVRVDGYIQKPFRVNQLQEKIDTIFNSTDT